MSAQYRSGWPKFKLGRAILAVFLIVLLGWFMLLMSLMALNGFSQPRWVTCHVTDAEATKGNRFSPTVWLIAIETTDCGTIVYRQALTDENVEFLADSFEPGGYEFKFRLSSQLAADGWVPMLQPSTNNYRPLD